MQRVDWGPAITSNGAWTQPAGRAWFRLRSITRERRAYGSLATQESRGFAHPTQALLTGLYERERPVAFIAGRIPHPTIGFGVWTPPGSAPPLVESSRGELLAGLRALYSAVDAIDGKPDIGIFPCGALMLGEPGVVPRPSDDGALPIDKLFRAMPDCRWALVGVAQPVGAKVLHAYRSMIIEEIRSVQSGIKAGNEPSPLADRYISLLERSLANVSSGSEAGYWRTGVYLLADRENIDKLAVVARGAFDGDGDQSEPIRIIAATDAGKRAAAWSLCDATAPTGPGGFRHALAAQTLLTSRALSGYMHLPALETPGFRIQSVAGFDVDPQAESADDSTLRLGPVLRDGVGVGTFATVPLLHLSRHVFVAGVTGSGKTNTILHLLREARTPFLCIEPAKAEYRELMGDARFKGGVRVYTLGNETVAPFRINPLEPAGDTSVGLHLDLLRSVFNAAFGMWTPLPQVLERCLHAVYADRGWDPVTGDNDRLGLNDDRRAAYPTMSELYAKVAEIVPALGYEQRVEADIRAALETRIGSLIAGGKGGLFDTTKSTSFDELFQSRAVLELEAIGDDDDKAFTIGLIFIKLVEHLRSAGPSALRHLLVIEEAHRLLSATDETSSEFTGNPRGKAVETFANLLAEIRSYGEGIIVADQIPTKLAPDVLKNTNLKIVHRIVAEDDRRAIGGAMMMDDRAERSLASLETYRAAVFREGDDAPLMVEIAETRSGLRRPTDADVAAAFGSVPVPSSRVAIAVRDIVERPAFRRTFAHFVVSIRDDATAVNRLWPGLFAVVGSVATARALPSAVVPKLIEEASHDFAHRRGRQASWTYGQTAAYGEALAAVLQACFERSAVDVPYRRLRDLSDTLERRMFEPFANCARICSGEPATCRYRWSVADRIAADPASHRTFSAAYARGGVEHPADAWSVARSAATHVVEYRQRPAFERSALCYAQQLSADALPAGQHRIVESLIAQAQKERTNGK